MRLTLRTLLAYLDDVLDPADKDELSQKIESSEFAEDLVHRTRDTMRRLRLSAPQVIGTGVALDPNTVAEYLDNVMPPESVGDFERICLESDMHLAEAAAGSPSFRIHLRGTGTFRPVSPVVFVTVVRGISSCEQLAFSVRSGPLATNLAFPYHPHVTVAHHLSDDLLDRAFEELSGFECEFDAAHFQLYAHDAEAGWQPTQEFALAGSSRP